MNRTPHDKIFIDNVSSVWERTSIPDFQRLLAQDHVDDIFYSLEKTIEMGLEPFITGCLITVVFNDEYYLLDGNHRLCAYKKILDKYQFDLKIYVQEIKVQSLREAEDLFAQTNNSVPVSKMPKGVKRSSVNQISKYFYDKYIPIVRGRKPLFVSTNANRPRINRAKFEEVLSKIVSSSFESKLIIEKIEDYIEKLNTYNTSPFKRQSNDSVAKISKLLDTADNVFGCRLGMVRLSEIYNLFGINNEGVITIKSHIPKPLKNNVWNKYCGRDERIAKCPFCEEEIRYENFHCAHNIAESNEGETTIDNLFPCCGTCNLSMGKKDFSTFMKEFKGK